MIILYIFLAIILIVAITVIIRTIRFKPKNQKTETKSTIDFNEEYAAKTLAEMIKCKTVSFVDKSLEDNGEFNKFKELLPALFPEIYKTCEYTEIGDRSILLKLKGESSDVATVMMAHYDVVPADEGKWKYPAYSGVIEEGCVWGRGSLDTKVTVNASMQALETLLKENYKPKNDLYLAFGGDEEINGHGASDIVDYFEKNNLKINFVLDEGGAVVSRIFPGVDKKCALIGTGEKGIMNIKLSAYSQGGHASSPPSITPIQRLANACLKISKNPFSFNPSKPALDLFNSLAPHSSLLYRIIFANLWLFSPVLSHMTYKKGGEMNALVRTTCAFTQIKGSDGANVLPTEASMVINIRINNGETVNTVINHIKSTINDPLIEIKPLYNTDPSPISSTEGEGYSLINEAILSTWEDAIISPYLMVACSDSRHWCRISNKVYRFSPVEMVNEIRGTIHGNNERIPLDVLKKSVEFYIKLLSIC